MPYLPKTTLRIKRFRSVVEDKMLNHHLIQGHHNYQKFVVLARPRTGSNLLVSLLQSHPNLRLFYELFNKSLSNKTFWDFINYDIDDVYQYKEEEPVSFLKKLVYREMPKSVSGVGFKLFYTHARSSNENQVWDYLKESKDLNIIHLKRKNLLKTHLSEQIALKTQIWVGKKNPSQIYPIKLDYSNTLEFFNSIKKQEEKNHDFFSDHNVFEVYYEDILKDIEYYSRNLQEFLNLPFRNLYISTPKQSSIPLSQAISNFFELKERFEGSPWFDLFQVN